MRKAALVLSGGAALGAAHIGAFRVLEKKFQFNFLAGVSAGAVVAAAIACGKTAQEISDLIHNQKLLRLFCDISGNQFGLVHGAKILKLLQTVYEDRTFADVKKNAQLFIGATDFQTGERVVLSSGKIAEAVRASLSVPVAFSPYFHQRKWLVDGMLSQSFPLDLALEKYSGDTIIGIDVNSTFSQSVDFSKKKLFGTIRNAPKIYDRMLRIIVMNQQHFPEDPRVRIMYPELGEFTAGSGKKLKRIEQAGKEAAKKMFG